MATSRTRQWRRQNFSIAGARLRHQTFDRGTFFTFKKLIISSAGAQAPAGPGLVPPLELDEHVSFLSVKMTWQLAVENLRNLLNRPTMFVPEADHVTKFVHGHSVSSTMRTQCNLLRTSFATNERATSETIQ
jgi:hypothetical protein